MKIRYKPRPIDRAFFIILGVLHVCNGLYLVGPWYLDVTGAGAAPLISMFNNDKSVVLFGYLILIDGFALIFAGIAKHTMRWYTGILSGALLTGFALRLYSLIGVLLVSESWRPPSYLSHMATVLVVGGYWVWVRVNGRVID